MARFKKKADPLSERARTLTEEIAALEVQIKALDGKLQEAQIRPRLRSAAKPQGSAVPATAREPVFEPVDQKRMKSKSELESSPAHFNELGVRKFDLAGNWRKFRNHFQGPPANNPKLVNYLAAGSIQGLRPMRYEKRVARNRVIALTLILLALLWGIIAVFSRH
jgi:hypothetical protein